MEWKLEASSRRVRARARKESRSAGRDKDSCQEAVCRMSSSRKMAGEKTARHYDRKITGASDSTTVTLEVRIINFWELLYDGFKSHSLKRCSFGWSATDTSEED